MTSTLSVLPSVRLQRANSAGVSVVCVEPNHSIPTTTAFSTQISPKKYWRIRRRNCCKRSMASRSVAYVTFSGYGGYPRPAGIQFEGCIVGIGEDKLAGIAALGPLPDSHCTILEDVGRPTTDNCIIRMVVVGLQAVLHNHGDDDLGG